MRSGAQGKDPCIPPGSSSGRERTLSTLGTRGSYRMFLSRAKSPGAREDTPPASDRHGASWVGGDSAGSSIKWNRWTERQRMRSTWITLTPHGSVNALVTPATREQNLESLLRRPIDYDALAIEGLVGPERSRRRDREIRSVRGYIASYDAVEKQCA